MASALTKSGVGVGFSGKDDRILQVVAATLTRGGHPNSNMPGRRKEDDVNLVLAPTLRSHPRPGSNDHGAIAFHVTQDPISGDVAPAMSRGNRQGTATIGVAFVSENQRAEVLETEYARQLTTGGGKPGQGYPMARVGATVRRLTPRECERLQGFPDDWTLIPWKGKPSPDNRRYAALGNAVTVQVAEWIGHRIAAADLALRGPGADTAEAAA